MSTRTAIGRGLRTSVRLVVGALLGLGLLLVVWLLDWAGEDYRELP